MNISGRLALAGFITLFLFSLAWGQPNPRVEDRADTWNSMWLSQNNVGSFGDSVTECQATVHGLELPGGSGQQYLQYSALWVGALIVEQGFETKRVSVATDGWLSPSINELWPGIGDTIIERSLLDTVNCNGESLADPAALADHEFRATFNDTLRDPLYVVDDPIDGPHRPLGIKVTRTAYSMMSATCDHIYWIRYRVENIGSNFLKNLYLGALLEGGVLDQAADPVTDADDDLNGFDPVSGIAYKCDNDGRRSDDSTGSDFTVPNVAGFGFLTRPDYTGQRVSFNWWVSHGDVALDYGPTWQDYALRDSLDMDWTNTYGTPMGDEHKYDLLRNGEQDFDQVRVNDAGWIAAHSQNGHAWTTGNIPANAADLANGFYARSLISMGPLGVPDYQDQTGQWIFRLNPGERFDVWMTCVGGMQFHDPAHPQPGYRVIDPSLYDFSDLRDKAETARNTPCMDWLGAAESLTPAATADFALAPVYPNPFNSTATIRFTLARSAKVEITVFDVLGREVDKIAATTFAAGNHSVGWNAHDLTSGIYFVQACVGTDVRSVQKAMLLK